MIFVTVGTDGPFDRLIRIVDDWAREHNRTDVFAQIGEKGWEPQFIAYKHFLEPPEFKARFQEADYVVAHAGMGTILSALNVGKPILVMPRKVDLGEQRNDHQWHTATRLSEQGKIHAAFDEAELRAKLDALETLEVREKIGPSATSPIVQTIRDFIANS